MDIAVDVVIVGAGIAGLTTSLGLYRYPSSNQNSPFLQFLWQVILLHKYQYICIILDMFLILLQRVTDTSHIFIVTLVCKLLMVILVGDLAISILRLLNLKVQLTYMCRLGVKSIVLESWDSLRSTGFALTLWTNAWRALDAVGVGDSLRQQHFQIQG